MCMKRMILLVLALLLLFAIVYVSFQFGVERGREEAAPTFYAHITEVRDGSLLVKGIDENDINHRGEFMLTTKGVKVYNAAQQEVAITQLEENMEIRIHYDGVVMESYPAQLGGVFQIDIID